MNKLPLEKRTQIIQMLVEGNSLRATSRMADVSINTVTKLLVDVGKACQQFHDETVKGIKAKEYNAMKYGASYTQSKRTYPKAWKAKRVMFGHGQV